MNTQTCIFALVFLIVGFIFKTLFQYLLETGTRKYIDMDMELIKAIKEEEDL